MSNNKNFKDHRKYQIIHQVDIENKYHYSKLLNWIIGYYDLSQHNKFEEGLEIYLPNGEITLSLIKDEKLQCKISVKSKFRGQEKYHLQRVISILNKVIKI